MKPEEVLCISSSDENSSSGTNKKDYVVYVSSSSEDETSLPDYNHCKYIKPLIKKATIFAGKLSKGSEFPLDAMQKMIQAARECLRKMDGDYKACTMIWDKLIHYILLAKSFRDKKFNNRRYKLEVVYIMADYIAFRCLVICKETQFAKLSQAEIHKEQQEICESMTTLLENGIDSLVMTLIRIKTTKAFAVILYRVYEAILSDKPLLGKVHEKQEFVALLLCYKKWKCLVNYKDEKQRINDIAENILPEMLPTVQGFHKAFHKILPDIPTHKESNSMRFLLVNQMMNVDDVCNNFFKVYEKMIELEFKDNIKNYNWKTTERPVSNLKIRLPPLSINWWVPAAINSSIQLSDSDHETSTINTPSNQLVLAPQQPVLLKSKARKRKRVRKNINQDCATDDNDEPETARGWISKKKKNKSKILKSDIVYGEVSSTTNVDVEEQIRNKSLTTVCPSVVDSSEEILKTNSVFSQEMKSSKALERQNIIEKEDAPKSNQNISELRENFIDNFNLLDPVIPISENPIEISKLKVNTNLELNWQAPGTSVSPTLLPYFNPEEHSLSDDAFWSKFNDDYFRLDRTEYNPSDNTASGSISETNFDTGIFSQLLDPSEFPELSIHVNMSQICENREWRKSLNQEHLGNEDYNGLNVSNLSTSFDSPLYY